MKHAIAANMPNQCRNCGRDVNNNYAPYQNAYATSASTTGGSSSSGGSGGSGQSSALEKSATINGGGGSNGMKTMTPQITAKVMFGTVGAIKELREKEQAEKNGSLGGGSSSNSGGGSGVGRRH